MVAARGAFFLVFDEATVTQSPSASCVEGTVTGWLKVVVGVHETVTWPTAGFWTSIELVAIETAATVPEADEKSGPGVVVSVVGFLPLAAATAVPDTASTAVIRTRPAATRSNDWYNEDETESLMLVPVSWVVGVIGR